MKGLPPLKGFGKRRDPRPELLVGEKNDYDQEDSAVQAIWATMGGRNRDLKAARQAAKLKRKLPQATTPELLTYLWLQQKGVPFEFQVEVNGGRRNSGGSVVDFLVHNGRNLAWRVQGTYWHNLSQSEWNDKVRRKLLEGAMVMGYQVDAVVDIWEGRIYADRENTLTMALAAIELGE
jgi:hypothetical protein